MGFADHTRLGREVAGALDWWREAGVDLAFADEPQGWLSAANETEIVQSAATARPVVAALQEQAPPPPRLGGDRQDWPNDLAAFPAWWLGEATLDHGPPEGRIAPRGPAGAPLMVLVEQPEAEDREHLLAGPQGRLLDAILAALGIAPDQAYVASVLPRHMPMPDWPALAEAGLGEVTAHHVRLAAPQRLIAFGANVSSLLGHDPAKNAQFSPVLHHEGPRMPALAAPGLSALLARPRGKARLWQALLDWMG